MAGAAAFGRLCVETQPVELNMIKGSPAAAFGRLCVETTAKGATFTAEQRSRLRAAVC